MIGVYTKIEKHHHRSSPTAIAEIASGALTLKRTVAVDSVSKHFAIAFTHTKE